MAEPFPRGRFVWHELMATDPDAAIPFYSKVIGWRVQKWEQNPTYRMWAMGDQPPMGGLMELPQEARAMGAPPHWLAYVAVPDVDASARRVQSEGGRVFVEPKDIPSVGRFAVIADPQGAALALFRPSGEGGMSEEPALGDVSWHELATTDWKAAWEFYHGLFGWEHESSFDMGAMGTYWMFKRAGGARALGGMMNRPAEMSFPPNWLCYIRVPNADRAAEAVRAQGGQVLNGPMDVPGGDRVAQCMDLQGAAFGVHSLAPQAARRPAPAGTTPAAKPASASRGPTGGKARPKAAKRRTVKKAAKKATKRRTVPRRVAQKRVAKKRVAKKKAGRRKKAR